ncbi:MAG: hypothetical protein ABIJ18_00950 [archaeon]
MAIVFGMEQAIEVLTPLALFIFGMAVYSVFIFHFYKFLARRDIIELNLAQYNTTEHPFLNKFLAFIFFIVEYILLFPILTFFWFVILTILLTFLAKDPLLSNILIASIALVGAVRVTAYYNEDLSKDLAKMLPFALLGIFLIDTVNITFLSSVNILLGFPALINQIVYYFLFVIALEIILRLIFTIFGREPISE